jgi:hypothetical protein
MFESLAAGQIASFRREGFLVVQDVLPDSLLKTVEDDYVRELDTLAASLHESGILSSDYREIPFSEKYVRILNEYPQVYNYLGISLPLVKEASFMPTAARVHASSAVLGMLTHPAILDIVESIIGPEILSNPTQHTRIKPPVSQVPTVLSANTDVGTTICIRTRVAIWRRQRRVIF